jgi:peptidoglycan hydrolase-like protein with peptidoglycan-binding domain
MDMRQFRERNTIAFNDIALVQLAERPGQAVANHTRLRQAQKQLQEAGFTPGALDGMLGPQTRVALQHYQAKHGLPKTGELDEATHKALGVH